jgi:hypothetical protein
MDRCLTHENRAVKTALAGAMVSGVLLLVLFMHSGTFLSRAVPTPIVSLDPLQIHLKTGIFGGITSPNCTEQWLGVPYAQPPLRNLRFKAPLYPKSSQRFREASKFGKACPQPLSSALGADVGEDCLVLNVRSRILEYHQTIVASICS